LFNVLIRSNKMAQTQRARYSASAGVSYQHAGKRCASERRR
jgi:hypothetical protein